MLRYGIDGTQIIGTGRNIGHNTTAKAGILRMGGSLRLLVQVLRRQTVQCAGYRTRFLGLKKKRVVPGLGAVQKFPFDLRKDCSTVQHDTHNYRLSRKHRPHIYIFYGTRNFAEFRFQRQYSLLVIPSPSSHSDLVSCYIELGEGYGSLALEFDCFVRLL